jgi:hypothetical protein
VKLPIRNPEGSVELARLDGDRVVMAHWKKYWAEHELVVEWALTLDGRPILVRDKKTGEPTVVPLHRWDDGAAQARQAERGADGRWQIDVPIAWHTVCVAVWGKLRLELDAERCEALYTEDLEVQI